MLIFVRIFFFVNVSNVFVSHLFIMIDSESKKTIVFTLLVFSFAFKCVKTASNAYHKSLENNKSHSVTNGLIATSNTAYLVASLHENQKINSIKRSKRSNSLHSSSFSYIIPEKYYEFKEIDLLRYIFEATKFKEIACEFTFQNCLLDLNNQRNVNGYTYISKKCFPLQKARFCLQEFNYKNSDCSFKSNEKLMTTHFKRFTRNFEICITKFPSSASLIASNSVKINRSIYKNAVLTYIFASIYYCIYNYFFFI